jgi:hypothetical protein
MFNSLFDVCDRDSLDKGSKSISLGILTLWDGFHSFILSAPLTKSRDIHEVVYFGLIISIRLFAFVDWISLIEKRRQIYEIFPSPTFSIISIDLIGLFDLSDWQSWIRHIKSFSVELLYNLHSFDSFSGGRWSAKFRLMHQIVHARTFCIDYVVFISLSDFSERKGTNQRNLSVSNFVYCSHCFY